MNNLMKASLLLILISFCGMVSGQLLPDSKPAESEASSLKPLQLTNSWWNDVFAESKGDEFISKKEQYISQLKEVVQKSAEPNSFIKQIDLIDRLFTELNQQNDIDPEKKDVADRPAPKNFSELLELNAVKRDLIQRTTSIRAQLTELEDSINRKTRYIEKLKVQYADDGLEDERLKTETEWVINKLQTELEQKALFVNEKRLQAFDVELKSISDQIIQSIPEIIIDDASIDVQSLLSKMNQLKAEMDVLNEQINKNMSSSESDALIKNLNYFTWLDKAISHSHAQINYLLHSSIKNLSDGTEDEQGLNAIITTIDDSTNTAIDDHEQWLERIDRYLVQPSALSAEEVDDESKRKIDAKTQKLAHDAKLSIGTAQAVLDDLDLLRDVITEQIAQTQGSFASLVSQASAMLSASWHWIVEAINTPLFSIGEQPITIYPLIKLMLIILAGFLVSKIVGVLIRRYERRKGIQNNSSVYLFNRVVHYLIIFIATMAGFKALGLNLGNFALIAGALSVGIGFGLQNLVSNFVSGLTIMLEKTLKVGDFIEMDTGITGTVKAINARSTQINTNDNIDVIIPNADLVTNTVTNWTLRESIRRIKIPFGVAYGSNKEQVKKAALEAAHQVQYTITQVPGKEPEVWMTGFGESSIDYWLLVWVSEYGATRPNRMRAYYLWELETQLAKNNIEIPFPQRDIHIKSNLSSVNQVGNTVLNSEE